MLETRKPKKRDIYRREIAIRLSRGVDGDSSLTLQHRLDGLIVIPQARAPAEG